MALCPHCRHVLPEAPLDVCPHCGGDPRAAARSPTPPEGAGAPPPVPLPAEPTPPPPGAGTGRPSGIPWEERDRIGFFNALVETTRLVLTEPGAFFRAMPVAGGLGSPLLYGVVVGWIGLVAASFYQALFHSLVGSTWGRWGTDRPQPASDLREDELRACLPREEALREAPDAAEGLFRVPRVIGG